MKNLSSFPPTCRKAWLTPVCRLGVALATAKRWALCFEATELLLLGVVGGVLIGVTAGVARGVAMGVIMGVAIGVIKGLAEGVAAGS